MHRLVRAVGEVQLDDRPAPRIPPTLSITTVYPPRVFVTLATAEVDVAVAEEPVVPEPVEVLARSRR